jgi:hypothetical protein
MRRTLGTDLQEHGTLKDAQGALRHASIRTTGDVYMQTIESSVLNAMNSRTKQILAGKERPITTRSQDAGPNSSGIESEEIGFRGCAAIGPSWTKF